LDGFEQHKPELDAIGAKVISSSVDPLDKAEEVAANLSFQIGYGVTREIADKIGAWWEDRRGIIQPSEFVVNDEGRIIVSSYSDGPLGRIEASDVVRLIKFYESRK
jgi:peroxiredoxin